MTCNQCGNKKKFQALITYYEPVEIWEFNDDGTQSRFNQPDTGDLEIELSCPVCNSKEISLEGFDPKSFVEIPLQRLDGDQWETRMKEWVKKD